MNVPDVLSTHGDGRGMWRRRRLLAVTAIFAAIFLAAAAGLARAQPLVPGIFAPFSGTTPNSGDVARMKKTGARVIRLMVNWSQVAPATRPAGFEPVDPGDPAYDWASADEAVTAAVASGFEPILDITGAPRWAASAPSTVASDGYRLGPVSPRPAALAEFAAAAAERYGGGFPDLPRIRYWQLYNEPNLDQNLRPQIQNGQPVSPRIYRAMVNAFARAVHGVHADNLVIAGGLTPFTFRSDGTEHSVAPLRFMRELLCMSAGTHPHPTCAAKVAMDVWAHHPYTSGGPTHKAANPDDVSLGDLPAMRRLLTAATKAGKIVSRKTPLFWVTEFSWDSSPPDSAAAPVSLLKRWVPQAMYQMWRNGVSLVTWFSLRDQPRPSFMQSGLYFENGKPKPYLRGFRFPVVAFPRLHGFYVWGRTPLGEQATVVVEQRTSGGWRHVVTLKSNSDGIFQKTVRASRTGFVRARLAGGEASLPFGLSAVPDATYNAFGS